MSTTSIFAEVLLVGFQALIWTLIIILNFINQEWKSSIGTFIYEKNVFFFFMTVAIAYSLGIIVDRIADSILEVFFHKRIENNIKIKIEKDGIDCSNFPGIKRMKLKIMNACEGMNQFLGYQRSKIRILRSTCLNFLFIFLVSIFSNKINGLNFKLVLSISFIFFCSSGLTWYLITHRYFERLYQAFDIINKDEYVGAQSS